MKNIDELIYEEAEYRLKLLKQQKPGVYDKHYKDIFSDMKLFHRFGYYYWIVPIFLFALGIGFGFAYLNEAMRIVGLVLVGSILVGIPIWWSSDRAFRKSVVRWYKRVYLS
jgi:hypothetical protein